MREEIYMIDHTWRYTARVVNPANFTINYELRQGFRSEKEARENQKNEQKEYEKCIKKIKNLTNIKYTFTKYIDYWFDNVYVLRGKTSTRVVTLYAITRLIKPNIQADILLPYITNEYINEIIEKCVRISKENGEICRKILRNLLKDAKLYGYLKTDIDLMSVPETDTKMQLLDHEQLHQLLTVAKEHQAFYFEILLALFCGLRQDEILALKYSNFDAENHTISIVNQYTREYTISKTDNVYQLQSGMVTREPKSGFPKKRDAEKYKDPIIHDLVDGIFCPFNFSLKDVAYYWLCVKCVEKKQIAYSTFDSYRNIIDNYLMPKFNNDVKIKQIIVARALYEKNKRQIERFQDNDYICYRMDGTPYNRSSMNRDFKKLLACCGYDNIHWHDLRHIYSTVLERNIVNIKTVSMFLGHNADFTNEVYIANKESVAQDCTSTKKIWTFVKPKNVKDTSYEISIPENFIFP